MPPEPLHAGSDQPENMGLDWLHMHPVPSFVIDYTGNITAANLAAETLCTMPRSGILGRPVRDVIRFADMQMWRLLDDPEKSVAAYAVTLSAGRSASTQADIRISEIVGEACNAERLLAIHPISPIAHSVHAIRGTPGKSGAAAAALLAHEIKNPLSGIKGAAQLLERSGGSDASRFTQLICSEVDRIAALIDRMQDLSREQALHTQPQNLYPAIFQARDSAQAGFAQGIMIEEDYDPSIPDVWIDHDSMVQMILNLLKNAAEALVATPNPCIRISTAYRHGLSYSAVEGANPVPLPVELTISDNGPGVPSALVDDMFTPFVTGAKLMSSVGHKITVPGGQGLGLALVEKLVRDMGGLVRYRRGTSPALTHFDIHLPIAKR
jgi:two-component system, NtrC family, nitrogen regulation sensor histidine kinase GlnL